MINRIIKGSLLETKKSILLLGPRQVGKSTLMHKLNPDLEINLSDEREFLKYSSQPTALREILIEIKARTVFIDEIQRMPKLLNTIQAIVDSNKNMKFFMTGSSARKLKRGDANLLPGRLVNLNLGSFVSAEFNYAMDTRKALEYGCLPEIYLSKDERENVRILKSYGANYIKEEIRAEAVVRSLDAFARFLQEVITTVGCFVDYTKVSKKSKISRHAIPRYYEILEDTLIGYRIFPFLHPSHSVDLVKHPKFYFFDNGVYNGLLENFTASRDRVGVLAEQLVFSQILHSSWAFEKTAKISTFRERTGIEVDFILENKAELIAIEVKNKDEIEGDDLAGLRFFNENVKFKSKKLFVFHMGRSESKKGNIWVLPWQKGLKEIGL